MDNTNEKKADSLLKELGVYLGVISKEEVTETAEEVKEEVVMEAETKEEKTEEVQFASELAEGEYELVDGTKFRIDESGNLVDVQAPEAREAEEEEEAKDVQDEMKENLEKSKLSEASKEIEKLKEEVAKLSEVKPVSAAPKKAEPREKIELTSNMTYKQRVMAAVANNLN